MKRCSKCGTEKPLIEYYTHTSHGSVVPHAECKSCTLKMNREIRRETVNSNTNERIRMLEQSEIAKRCVTCKQVKGITDFNIRRSEKDGHETHCKSCASSLKNRLYANHKQLSTDDYLKWRSELNAKNRLEKLRLKTDVFSHYSKGGIVKCANPYHIHSEDITDLDILTLDHINGDGKKDKDATGRRIGGILIYRRCKKLGYPSGFQVLCANCQFKKAVLNNERYTNRWQK